MMNSDISHRVRHALSNADKVVPLAAWVVGFAALYPSTALAHPAAAEPPRFPPGECIQVVDKSQQQQVDISYQVPMDDTALTAGDLPLSDAKTHQFFAFAGTLFTLGTRYAFFPYAEPTAKAADVPFWITQADITRAQNATLQLEDAGPAGAIQPTATVLEDAPAFAGRFWRVTADDARRPIVVAQSVRPIHWDLRDVPPGVYTVAGYVFSPPYNDWAIRSGAFKIVDATHDPAAGELAPIAESLFAYEGRRIQGCLDVPAGTTLDAYYMFEDYPQEPPVQWASGRPVQTGPLDLCMHLAPTQLTGSIRVRMDLTAPDGSVTSLRSRDTLTYLPGSGTCMATDTLCCEFAGAQVQPTTAGAAGAAGASAPEPRANTPPAMQPAMTATAPAQSGCACTPIGGRTTHGWPLAGLCVLLSCWRRRRRRRVEHAA